ncbi:3'-5' exonuclease [Streptomyces lycii]|uniref:3'-5' exonuclease n=1 Tax=Streptomyces lycii TaxID=2654337 RepID=A0ABQ7FBF0_9ACTN|nr:3'-5' exonuclease [Streptomyces lycii]KAF4405590.1 3'-5' exonuclease [Streptomyces lycii]
MNFTHWPALCAVDVEGNGARPPDLVEVATLPIRDGRLDTGRQWLIRPPRPITWQATRVHNLTTDDVSQCPPWQDVADEIRTALNDTWICAHHAHVDYRVLNAHLPDWQPAGVLDTLRLAKHTVPGLNGYSLDALIRHFGLDLTAAPGERHRAAYDAYAAGQLLLTLAVHYDSWQTLAAAAAPSRLPGSPDNDEKEPTLW